MTSPIVPPLKRCTKCKHELPATREFFYSNRSKSDGLSTECKTCVKQKRKDWYAENTERAKAYQVGYRQVNADYLAIYHSKKYRRNRADILAKGYERRRRYYHNHPEKYHVYVLNRMARKRQLPNTLTHDQWVKCLEYWHDCCAYCGAQQGLWNPIVSEHYIPLNDANCPGTVVTNIIPACRECNSSKSDTMPLEWLRDKFGPRRAAVIQRAIEAYFESVRS